MITAIVLVKAAADRIPEAAQAIADLKDVAEVYSCAADGDGFRRIPAVPDVDIIAIVRVSEHEQLTDVVAGQLSQSHGVVNTDTRIAYHYYSRKDAEAAFWLGFKDDA